MWNKELNFFKVFLIVLLCYSILLLNLYILQKKIDDNPQLNNNLKLRNILDAEIEPKNDKNLFFIDTFRAQLKYNKKKSMTIGKRQACAIESGGMNFTITIKFETQENHFAYF